MSPRRGAGRSSAPTAKKLPASSTGRQSPARRPRAVQEGLPGYGDALGRRQAPAVRHMVLTPYADAAAGFRQASFSASDLFDAFFGGAGAARGTRAVRSRMMRGQDTLVPLDIDLSQAVFGGNAVSSLTPPSATRPVTATDALRHHAPHPVMCARGPAGSNRCSTSLGQVDDPPVPDLPGFRHRHPRPCRRCSGDGRIRHRRTLTIKVPAGVDTGTRIQLTGRGRGAGMATARRRPLCRDRGCAATRCSSAGR